MGDNSAVPFLPGYSFGDPTKRNFPLSHTLAYDRGSITQKVIEPNTARHALELLDAQNHMYDDAVVQLTYGPRKNFLHERVLPDFVLFDKKVLRFFGYFRENVDDSWGELFRIHHVKVLYYLEDDTMEIDEPRTPNSGLVQGLMVKRQKLPHPNGQRMYHWKDLNVGIELIAYGRNIQIVNCDEWTQEHLQSNGIIMNPKVAEIPTDPYVEKLKERGRRPAQPIRDVENDKLWKFLNMDKKVLRFYGLWDDTLNEPHTKKKVIILFYLADDTMEVLSVLGENDGEEPFGTLIKRQKIPVDPASLPETFPSCYLEYGDKEVTKWFGPSEFRIGKEVVVFNRPIFLYNCDKFTRDFYRTNLGVVMPEAIEIKDQPKKIWPRAIAPHDGFGTWEDSLQSCIYTRPRPPKKDLLKMYYNDNKFLRFSAHMDTFSPVDCIRKFIITFFPGDDTVKIHEQHVPNSGIASGPFLKRCRLLKAVESKNNRPIYYDASDFYIGATINASGRKFVIDNADKYVLKFMEGNPHLYSEETIQAHRNNSIASRFATEPLRSQKVTLEKKLRNYVMQCCGNEPLPISLELEESGCHRQIVQDRLLSANIPLPQSYIDDVLKLCSDDNGNVDTAEVQKILSYSFGQYPENQ